ncbi:MAG: hypothetical protein R2834_00260 [Rhodothermales bacterium]
MHERRRSPRSLLAALLLLGWLGSLTPAWGQSFAVVQLESNTPEALFYADSLYLGKAETHLFLVPRATRQLRLIYPTADVWSMTPVQMPVDLRTVDTLQVALDFMYHYSIKTVPFDANVFLETPDGRALLGTTPLLYTAPDPLMGMLLVQKDGYELKRFTPGDRVWNRLDADLEPITAIVALDARQELARRTRSKWLNLALGGAAIASGVLAVHYKMKADSRYDAYAEDGDPRLRAGFERYDRRAYVALGAMQVGVGVLAIRLVRQ